MRYSDADVVRHLRAGVKSCGGLRAWARFNGFSAGTVCDVLAGRSRVPPRLARALGFKPLVGWERDK